MTTFTTTVKKTGEEIEFDLSTPEQVMEAWLVASEYIKAYERAKEKMKTMVKDFVDEQGKFEHGDYMFKVIPVQRYTYDKAILRQELDEDTLDLFLEPDKTAIDNYLKDNLEQLGEVSTILRRSMIEKGKPYTMTKLEKLVRDEN